MEPEAVQPYQPQQPQEKGRSRKTKKRLAAVAAITAGVLASAGVYATTLNVTASDESGGMVDVTSCDGDGVVTAAGTPTYNAATSQYRSDEIIVSGIAATCDGSTFYVTAAEADGTALATITPRAYDADVDGGTFTVTGLTAFALEDLDRFVVAIQE